MTIKLPEPLGEYFAAANAHDANRVAACFAPDAIVHDEGADIHGRDAIRTWAAETSRKYRHTAEVTRIEKEADRTVATAHLTGDFPGSPIDLRYRFKLAGRQITSLEIG